MFSSDLLYMAVIVQIMRYVRYVCSMKMLSSRARVRLRNSKINLWYALLTYAAAIEILASFYFNSLCMRVVKALISLRECACSSRPLLLTEGNRYMNQNVLYWRNTNFNTISANIWVYRTRCISNTHLMMQKAQLRCMPLTRFCMVFVCACVCMRLYVR